MKAGETINCPHCKGRKGKTELLYYWVDCPLCLGVGKFTIDKILKTDSKNGDIKATISINKNNENVPRWVTKTDWLF